jgi:hypothetical protein
VELSVKDTGAGIDAPTMEHIFEPFFTTKEKVKGTGLDLSTVYGIVKQHGGDISVASQPGRGTTFTVSLPRVTEAEPAADTQGAAKTGLTGGPETILLVEDDSSVRAVARDMLLRLCYRVLEAENAEQCVATFQKSHADIDLLLTDVIMSGMNGKKLFETLSTLNTKLKALYISGYSHDVLGTGGGLPPAPAPATSPLSLTKFMPAP